MGTDLYVHAIDFEIKREYFKFVIEAADRNEKLSNWPSVKRLTGELAQVEEWFRRMGYSTHFEPDQYDDLTTIWWDGHKYLDQQEAFFRAIAKYVKAGSFINCEVEVGDHFQWYFNEDCMIVKEGKVVYE